VNDLSTQIKAVPGPAIIPIKRSQSPAKLIAPFGAVIEKECNDNWHYHSMEHLGFLVKKGLIARLISSLLGGSPYAYSLTFYMLIFVKSDYHNPKKEPLPINREFMKSYAEEQVSDQTEEKKPMSSFFTQKEKLDTSPPDTQEFPKESFRPHNKKASYSYRGVTFYTVPEFMKYVNNLDPTNLEKITAVLKDPQFYEWLEIHDVEISQVIMKHK